MGGCEALLGFEDEYLHDVALLSAGLAGFGVRVYRAVSIVAACLKLP